MNESVLASYFRGRVSAQGLARDLKGAITQTGRDTYMLRAETMSATFVLTCAHLIKLCSDVEAGFIPPESLEAVGFGLIASDQFEWAESVDCEHIAEVLYDWSSPPVNYPLTVSNVAKWRHFLETGRRTFTPNDAGQRLGASRVVRTHYAPAQERSDGG